MLAVLTEGYAGVDELGHAAALALCKRRVSLEAMGISSARWSVHPIAGTLGGVLSWGQAISKFARIMFGEVQLKFHLGMGLVFPERVSAAQPLTAMFSRDNGKGAASRSETPCGAPKSAPVVSVWYPTTGREIIGPTTIAYQIDITKEIGGAVGNRTPDLLIANEALYHLSYGPKVRWGGAGR